MRDRWRFALSSTHQDDRGAGGGLRIPSFKRRGGSAQLEALAPGLAGSTGLVMLAALGSAPQVGGLMLMSMMAVLALSAVQLSRRHQLTLCVLLAAGGVAVLAATGASAGVPTATAAEQLLSGVWLAWLMAKVSAHNIAGTRLRDQVRRANAKLAQALQALEEVAATEDLTRLPNRLPRGLGLGYPCRR